MIIDERQTVHLADDQIARVLSANPRSIIQSALHKGLSRVLVGHAALRAVGFPLAPRRRSSRIIHAEKQIIVTLDKDGRREIGDAFLVGCLADVAGKLEYDLLAQITAQRRTIRIPQFHRPTGGAPIAAATIDKRRQDRLQIRAETVIKRVFPRPRRATRVLRRIEAKRQTGGHATTRLVFLEQRFEDHTRIRTIKRPFALVIAVREQMAGIIILRL